MKLKKLRISISIQISIFLVLVAFIPVVVMMALKTYETQLLEMFENSNVQQGRLIAAALQYSGNNEKSANSIINNMSGNFTSRIRILDKDGLLIADSAKNDSPKKTDVMPQYKTENLAKEKKQKTAAEDSFVYRLFSLPVRIYRKILRRPSPYETADFYNGKSVLDGEEIKSALNGRYGAITRISTGNQISVTLYSAVPVFDDGGKIAGAVLVSRSTYRILRNLYELRRDMALVYLRSLIAVALIAIFFAFRITVPLKRLSKEAMDCADRKGRIFFTKFTGQNRIDEIGELSRSFSNLVQRLNRRIQFSQAFSADISHEFKNPLAAIRSSAELLGDAGLSSHDRNELSTAAIDEVNHLQILLNGIRNISKIDAGENLTESSIPVVPFLKNIISRIAGKHSGTEIEFRTPLPDGFEMKIPEDYFDRLTENLIDNAAGFGTHVIVTAESEGGQNFIMTVEDNGKGIAPGMQEKIFERFYSERPDDSSQGHTGLGLSTVKAITDALEGEVTAGNGKALGGAIFTVKIPCRI